MIRINADNNSLDHRMRLRISASCLSFSKHNSGVHFGERELANDTEKLNDGNWRETFAKTRHFVQYISFGGNNGGFLAASDDSREYEFVSDNTVYFTLWRGVGDLSREDLITRQGGAGFSFKTPDAQCLGNMDFWYYIGVLENEARGGQCRILYAQTLLSDSWPLTVQMFTGLFGGIQPPGYT